MCGKTAPKAMVGNNIESTAAAATFDPLARNNQDPFAFANTTQSTNAAALNAHMLATAIIPVAGFSK